MSDYQTQLESILVVVVGSQNTGVRSSKTVQKAYVSPEIAFTIWATCSEDPHSWDELVANWPRYRTDAVPEFLSTVPLTECSLQQAVVAAENKPDWIFVDFCQKRILTGPGIESLGRNVTLALADDNEKSQPLPFHLPPWWKLQEQTNASSLLSDRSRDPAMPYSDRPFLYGDALYDFVEQRITLVERGLLVSCFGDLESQRKPRERFTDDDRRKSNARYKIVKEIHRDWLMTKHPLVPAIRTGATVPRDLLHGGCDWNDKVIFGQQRRFEFGFPMVASPPDGKDYDVMPLGREEVIMYFDYCREVIEAGCWDAASGPTNKQIHQQMRAAGQRWLETPHEGGSPPRFVIECCRRRVPRATGVSIVGMDEVEEEHHLDDCDCPVCNMMAEEIFGPSFSGYDGHHLELDGEFAFSLWETREEWKEEQCVYDEFDDSIEDETTNTESTVKSENDDFESVWKSTTCDAPIPGDSSRQLQLAFLLTEIVGDLQSSAPAPDLIERMNQTFRDFRHAEMELKDSAKAAFVSTLEEAAEQLPTLRSKVSDFESKLDEFERDHVLRQ